MELRAIDDPEANGRQPRFDELRWTVQIPLESGETLLLHMGRKSRDMLFGMLIADCAASGEEEPEPIDESLEGWPCRAGFAPDCRRA